MLPATNIQIATLCDAATDYNGKLCILGTFDTITASQMPAVHPQCSVALRVSFSRFLEGPHQFHLRFVDADGKPVMPVVEMSADIAVPSDYTFQAKNFILHIQHMQFDRPGQYAIDVDLDGNHITSIPLLVNQTKSESGANPE